MHLFLNATAQCTPARPTATRADRTRKKRSADNKATRTAESPGGRTKSNCRAANSPREKTVGKLGLLLQKKRFRASLNLPQQQQQQKQQQQQQQHSIAAGEVLEGSARLSSLSLCQLLARSPGELLNLQLNAVRAYSALGGQFPGVALSKLGLPDSETFTRQQTG